MADTSGSVNHAFELRHSGVPTEYGPCCESEGPATSHGEAMPARTTRGRSSMDLRNACPNPDEVTSAGVSISDEVGAAAHSELQSVDGHEGGAVEGEGGLGAVADTDSLIESSRLCRICLDADSVEPLIAPCQCRGTQKYVHRTCLNSWRAAKEGFAFAHCTECRAQFVLRAHLPPDRRWRKLQFRTCVAVDHALLFISVQIVVASVSILTYWCFASQLRQQLGYDDRPGAFLALAMILAVAVGIIYGFFIAVICSENIEERHAGILQRQPLTHEYVVEDLEQSSERHKKLEHEHEIELASLGLL